MRLPLRRAGDSLEAVRFPALLVLLASCASAEAQTTWYVDASAPPPGAATSSSPDSSLRAALATASTHDGDAIVVAPGIYLESIDFLGKAVRVRGPASGAAAVIDAQGAGPVARFASGEGASSILEDVARDPLQRDGTGWSLSNSVESTVCP